MKKARLIFSRKISSGTQELYRLSPALDGNEYVISSAISVRLRNNDELPECETYLLPANENGSVTSWMELDGSAKGYADPARAIKEAGYTIVEG